MYGNMFYFGEGLFNRIMDAFSDIMAFLKRKISVSTYLQIHINAVSEFAGVENIYGLNSFLSTYAVSDLLLDLFRSGVIHHLLNSFHKDVVSSL